MKPSALKNLREQPVEDLRKQIDTLRQDLMKSRFSSTMEGKQLGVKYRDARRQIARIETLITQKAAVAAKAK